MIPPASTDTAEMTPTERPVLSRLKELEPGAECREALSVPALREGEQFRFHFDMTRCIGCRCCEVACNEQNNNPPEVNWRRVGEIEGGVYPNVARLHVSMACNHCIEPTCLEGCPVDAYTKLRNGVVDHDAETCIGCQYCTWSCPYGVPQFHAERRVVTKCNMCVDRLADGDLPACVNACPTSAIEIEAVNVGEWRTKIESADAPGVPPADLTLSTTRITLPEDLPATMGEISERELTPEHAHWSLVFFLVLSQWSVGLFAALPIFAGLTGESWSGFTLAASAFVIGIVSLHTALFHLGRPVHAVRAMKAWRHSWLSREVIAFAIFGAFGVAPSIAALFDRGVEFVASSTVCALLGAIGIWCSVGIYRIPARPAWDSRRTPIQFFATTLLLGAVSAIFVIHLLGAQQFHAATLWTLAAIAGGSALAQLFSSLQLVFHGLGASDSPVRGAALLLTRRFSKLFWLRSTILCAVVVLVLVAESLAGSTAGVVLSSTAFGLALLGELIGRYLFFVTVVPRNMPGGFFSAGGSHA